MTTNGKLLIVDDEKIAMKNLAHVMKKEGYEVVATQSGAGALAILEKEAFDVVLTDIRMEKIDGMQVLKKCKKMYPDTEVVMVTGFATLESAVEAMKEGAFNYIAKPFRLDEVRKVVAEAMEKITLKRENAQLREQIESYKGNVRIITQNQQMQKLLEIARQVAPTNCNVLISGESGTGKELFAKYAHYNSERAQKSFVAINCGSFNEDLLSNELFGHVKGAFTGATVDKKGLIETASGGTLFLDEITEMSPPMQAKLLRVIQESEVLRLGGTEQITVDVRFIAATNRDVADAVKSGKFRRDLYFRLNVVNLHIPPLNQREGDIPLLCFYFLKKYAAIMKKNVVDITPEAMEILKNHDYPGNVRELENLIERGVAISAGSVIGAEHLPDELRNAEPRAFRKKDGRLLTLEEQEREYIKWVLTETGGKQKQAAEALGIDRVSLWRKLKKQEE